MRQIQRGGEDGIPSARPDTRFDTRGMVLAALFAALLAVFSQLAIGAGAAPELALVAVAVDELSRVQSATGPGDAIDPHSPWHETDGWLSESGLASAMSVEPFSHDVELHPQLRDLLDDLRLRSPGD